MTIINADGALVVVIRNWLAAPTAQNLHDRLRVEVPWINAQ